MIIADWIFLGLIAAVIILGLIFGFGSCLKFFTSGVFGVIISVIVTYFLLGIVNSWQFVADLLVKLNGTMDISAQAAAVVDQILLAVIIFIIVQILRIIAVKLVVSLFEMDNGVVKAFNRTLGVIAMAAVVTVLGLLVFQIIYLVDGSTAEQVSLALAPSKLGLGWLYEHNPLRSLADFFA